MPSGMLNSPVAKPEAASEAIVFEFGFNEFKNEDICSS
jgi:hypothetical protein